MASIICDLKSWLHWIAKISNSEALPFALMLFYNLANFFTQPSTLNIL